MSSKQKEKQKNLTIDDLATMVARGFANLERNMITKIESEIGSVREELRSEVGSVKASMIDLEDRLSVQIGGLEKIIKSPSLI